MLPPPFLMPLAMSFPQEKASSLPCDVAQDLRGLEAQLRRQEGLERELVGTERQVSPGLAASPTQSHRPRWTPICSLAFSPLPQGHQPCPLCMEGMGQEGL